MTDPIVAVSRAELTAALALLRDRTIALVPTMGALHAGHRSLMVRAGELGDAVVVSIFVNPLQFGPGEDLSRYPRSLEADIAACAAEGVAVVFAPTVDVMYPHGQPSVHISAGPLGAILEGAVRPGHFDGVLTVVAKLFALVQPAIALFGDKDAQQLALIRRMVDDLDLPVRIENSPTIRSAAGLALSSRNAFLDDAAAEHALALSRALAAAGRAASGGSAAQVVAAACAVLAGAADFALDYCTLVDPATFEIRDALTEQPPNTSARLLVAGRVGGVRLIDNVLVSFSPQLFPQGDRP